MRKINISNELLNIWFLKREIWIFFVSFFIFKIIIIILPIYQFVYRINNSDKLNEISSIRPYLELTLKDCNSIIFQCKKTTSIRSSFATNYNVSEVRFDCQIF